MYRAVFIMVMSVLVGCHQTAPAPQPGTSEYPLIRITERTYVVHGPQDLPNKQNRGFINNPGFVVTNSGVVVVDPGSSRGVGDMLLAHIRQITDHPVIAVFNTHAHGDHWLGNEAVSRAFPQAIIYGHPAMKELVDAGEGKTWIKMFEHMTEGALVRTEPVGPGATVNDGDVLTLGGLAFKITHTGTAHTRGDIMIEIPDQKVMFLGDNASYRRIIRLDDGHFKGNIKALEVALQTKSKYFIPGHGPSGGADRVGSYKDYLSRVRAGVAELYQEGMPDYEMKDRLLASLQPWQSWAGFDENIGRHISLVYLEIEKEAF